MKRWLLIVLICLGFIGLAAGAVYLYYSNILTATINADRALSLVYTDVSSNTANGSFSWTPTDIQANLFAGEQIDFDANLTNRANHTFQAMTIEVEVINWGTLDNRDLYLEYTDGSGTSNMSLCNSDVYHMYGYIPAFDIAPAYVNQFNVNMQLNESIAPGTYYLATTLIKDATRKC